MRFGILGTPEVRQDGDRLPIGGPQQRALLAALLLNTNRVVSADRLIGYLWAEEPPPAARSLLQGCVAQLRRVCREADPGRERLLTRAPGYLLEVAPGELDLDRFEALVAEAGKKAPAEAEKKSPAEAGKKATTEAVEVLGEALALWRGPALDGVDGETFRAEAARLEEVRLTVVERRLELRLRLGHYPAIVAELEGLVRDHPLRERLWTLLMLAQYGADRQADALASFQRLRQILVEQLGVEPGAGPRQVHATILAGGDALSAYKIGVDLGASRPSQLPPAVAGFTGRAEQLRRLEVWLGEEAAAGVVVISGIGGVGKTALAVHWGQSGEGRFPDGRLYVNLQGARPIDALSGFLQALGVPAAQVPAETERATADFRSLVASRRMLVVLDNALTAEQVRPLLPGGPHCRTLVTSRTRLDGLVARDGARLLALDPLPAPDAVALIGELLGLERTEAEPEPAAELARLCGHLPLALRIAAANLSCRPDRKIADEVAVLAGDDRLTALAIEGDPQSAVRAAFEQSYLALDPAERLLFRRLALVPGPDFGAGIVAALCGNEVAVRPGLDRLARAGLIQPAGADRYAMHDLLRLYAAELEEPSAEAVDRLYAWYLSGCEAAARVLYPGKLRMPGPEPEVVFDGPGPASAWFDAELPGLIAATLRAAGKGHHPAAWELATALRGFLWMRMSLVDWERTTLAGLAAAESAGHVTGMAAGRLSLADLRRCQGRYPEAIGHYRAAAELGERTGWWRMTSAALGNLGSAYFWLGDLGAAADYYRRALRVAQDNGQLSGQAVRLGNLGLVAWLQGRYAEAAGHQAEALALHRKLGDRANEGVDLANLGECRLALGDLDAARSDLTAALEIHTEVGDRGAEAETRAVLAAVEREAGKTELAYELASAALELARSTGDRPIVANALTVLAGVHDRRGETTQAVALYREALESAGARHAEITALIGLAGSTRDAGYAVRARDLAQEGGFLMLEERARAVLAEIHSSL